MKRKFKNNITKLTFIINALVFFTGGMELIAEEKLTFSIVQFVAGICNFLMIFSFSKKKPKVLLNYFILIMNVIAASSVSIYYFTTGGRYIQYAWMLVAVMSAIVIFIHKRKGSLN